MFFYIALIILYIPLRLIYPVRVIGNKNVPKKGRIIFACNHQTLNDPIIIGTRVRRRFRYMAKAPLFKNKFFGAILKGLGAYPVNNKSIDMQAIKTTMKHLKKERAILIFPEGARLKSSESNELKNGVAMFALKTKTPVVPSIFIKKTNAFCFNTLLIGKPINFSEMEQFKDRKLDKETYSEASEILVKEMYKLLKEYNNKKLEKKKQKIEIKHFKKIEKQFKGYKPIGS